DDVFPLEVGGRAHDHLVTGQVRLGIGAPAQLGVRAQADDVDQRAGRHRGSVGQGSQGDRVDPGGAGDVVEVDELRQVAPLHAVDHDDVVVLVPVVLVRLGEPHGRVALLEERNVVAAAAQPVPPVDDLHVHPGGVVLGDVLDEPG